MARKETMDEEYGVFTLNETTVGKGGYNRKRSDVQLIQFFLRRFYTHHPELFVLLPKTKTGANFIIIDGSYGGQTEKGILLFQKNRKSDEPLIATDGLVNVAHSVMSSISNTHYTIHFLNGWFMRHAEGREHHGSLENHWDLLAYAPELHYELATASLGNEFS